MSRRGRDPAPPDPTRGPDEPTVMGRVTLVATLAAVAFFAGITGIHAAYTLAYVLVLLMVVAWGWSRIVSRRLAVFRESPQGVFMVGDAFSERFTVRNHSVLPVPYCEVHDVTSLPGYLSGRACSMGPGQTVSWVARGTFRRRGEHAFGPLRVTVGDPFGLFPRTLEAAATRTVLVYPAVHPVRDLGSGWAGGVAGDTTRGRPVDVAPDVSTIREYDTADGMSRIHWASTAKTGRLMSRTYDTRQSSDVLVVLDLRRGTHYGVAPESTLEYAVSVAASIAHSGVLRGQAVGLVCNDSAHTAVGAGRGEAQRLRLLTALATVTDDGDSGLAEMLDRHAGGWRGRGGLVVVTADRDGDWIEALVDAGVRGQRHLAVVVDPVSFGAPGTPFVPAAAWRLALDWQVVRQGDNLGEVLDRRAAAR